jgi:tetratricopeptide (TPR) repeat protein
VAEQRRTQRPSSDGPRRGGGRPTGGKPPAGGNPKSGGKPSSGGKPQSGGKPPAGGNRDKSAKSNERSVKWTPDEGRAAGRGSSRSTGRPPGGGKGPDRNRSERSGAPRAGRDQAERTADQAIYDGPDLPLDISGAELDHAVSAQLKGLPEKLAARVARHLAAAGTMIDSNPELAYQHTLAARARAPRIAVVREATGEAAYAAGHYAEALAELRAAKRMNGATAYLPIMADCHRALGKPQDALKLAKSPGVANFGPEAKAEMTIVEAGARRDLGQLDAALRTLELAPLMSKTRAPWVVRLRYAYADTLVAAGREQDALAWFHRTYSIDSEELTDAAERAEALEKQLG